MYGYRSGRFTIFLPVQTYGVSAYYRWKKKSTIRTVKRMVNTYLDMPRMHTESLFYTMFYTDFESMVYPDSGTAIISIFKSAFILTLAVHDHHTSF